MILRGVQNYATELTGDFGRGWNRFWFWPQTAETLAALRICVGLIALYVIGSFGPDLQVFFGPGGLVPQAMVDNWVGQTPARISAFKLVSSPGEITAVFALSLAAVALFTAGAFTRVTSVLAFLAVVSFSHRGPLLTQLVEPLLALATFYLCLGPCGAAISVDAWRKRKASSGTRVATPECRSVTATISQRLLQLHTSAIYVMMGLGKISAGEVWFNGDAVWRMAAKPESRLIDLTGLLYNHPFVYQGWSHLIVLFELAFGILIWQRRARPLLLALSVMHWAGLAILTGDVPFCLLMLALGLAFVRPESMRGFLAQRDSSAE